MHLCPFSVCREIPATFSNPRYFFSCPSTHLAFSLPASVTFRDAVSILPIALSSWRLHQCRRPLAYWISSGVISIGGPLTCEESLVRCISRLPRTSHLLNGRRSHG